MLDKKARKKAPDEKALRAAMEAAQAVAAAGTRVTIKSLDGMVASVVCRWAGQAAGRGIGRGGRGRRPALPGTDAARAAHARPAARPASSAGQPPAPCGASPARPLCPLTRPARHLTRARPHHLTSPVRRELRMSGDTPCELFSGPLLGVAVRRPATNAEAFGGPPACLPACAVAADC